MRPYCEIMVSEVFPMIRALMAKELTENLGFTQQEAANKMGLTQPAISQYKKEMRASRIDVIENNEKVMRYITEGARTLANSKNPVQSTLLCDICKEIRASGLLCVLHRKSSSQLKDCTICFDAEAKTAQSGQLNNSGD